MQGISLSLNLRAALPSLSICSPIHLCCICYILSNPSLKLKTKNLLFPSFFLLYCPFSNAVDSAEPDYLREERPRAARDYCKVQAGVWTLVSTSETLSPHTCFGELVLLRAWLPFCLIWRWLVSPSILSGGTNAVRYWWGDWGRWALPFLFISKPFLCNGQTPLHWVRRVGKQTQSWEEWHSPQSRNIQVMPFGNLRSY